MPIYLALGKDANGKQRSAKIDADSERHARDKAKLHGLTVETIAEVTNGVLASKVAAPAPAVPLTGGTRRDAQQPFQPRLEQGHAYGAPVINIATPRRGSSLGIASIVLGALAFVICWVPVLNLVGVPLSALGLVLGIAGIITAMTRRGASIGLPIAGAAISGLAAGVAIFMYVALGAAINGAGESVNARAQSARTAQPAASVRQPTAQPAPVKPEEAAPDSTQMRSPLPPAPSATSPQIATPAPSNVPITPAPAPSIPSSRVQIGDVVVSITSVRVGPVPVEYLGRRTTLNKPQLMVGIRITNRHANKKIDYYAWSDVMRPLGERPRVTDDHGNKYRPQPFGIGTEVVGQVRVAASIYPSGEVEDLLVFEPPVSAATHLDIVLDGVNVDSEGLYTLRLMTKDIKRDP